MRALFAAFVMLIAVPACAAEAQWLYLAPPWNFAHHSKYSGMDVRSIPDTEWEQLGAFDTAGRCENARVFAREIRNLSPNDRERLLALFASGAESRARKEARVPIASDQE